jgi:hypothetical protein
MLAVPVAVALPQQASAQARSIRICDRSYDLGDQQGIDVAVRQCLGPNARVTVQRNATSGTITVQANLADMPLISIGRPPRPSIGEHR